MRKGLPAAFLVLAAGLACERGALQPGDGRGGGPGGQGTIGGTGAGGQPGDPVRCAQIATSPGIFNPCGQINSLAYSPDGQLLAAGFEGPRPNVRVWRLSDGVLLRSIDGVGGAAIQVAFSPDGKLLATAGGYRIQGALSGQPEIVKLWNVADGSPARTIWAHCGPYASTAAFSHDGTMLVTACHDSRLVNQVEIWRIADDVLVGNLSSDGVNSVAFSPDDKWVVIAGADGRAKVWSFPGEGGSSLTATSGEITDAAFSPDGNEIATTGPNSALAIWGARSGALLQTLQGHTAPVRHVLWAGNDRLISNDGDGVVRAWTRDSGGHFGASGSWATGGPSLGIALSPDQTMLAVSGGAEPGFWFVPVADIVR